MTKYIFHGEDLGGSRNELNKLLSKLKDNNIAILTLNGQKIAAKDLEESLGAQNLFSESALLIENLMSRPLSKDKKKLINILASYQGTKNIVLWEKKEITKAGLKSLGSIQSFVAKVPAVIFKFLDSLYPGNSRQSLKLMHECNQLSEEGFIFVMFCRHIGELMIAQSGDTNTLIPFKRSRLIAQAQKFPPPLLNKIHTELLQIDRAIKTGNTKLSYLHHLDLLILSLLN